MQRVISDTWKLEINTQKTEVAYNFSDDSEKPLYKQSLELQRRRIQSHSKVPGSHIRLTAHIYNTHRLPREKDEVTNKNTSRSPLGPRYRMLYVVCIRSAAWAPSDSETQHCRQGN